MNRLAIAVLCAACVCPPSFAGDPTPQAGKKTPPSNEQQAGKSGKSDSGKKDAAEAGKNSEEMNFRVKFDKETAKGEVTCKGGKLNGKSVEYQKCAKLNVEKYEEIAELKKIISKEKLEPLGPKEKSKAKKLAAKLAFLDSAKKQIDKGLDEIQDKKESIEYKKAMGACKKISKELNESISECSQDKSGAFNCPNKVAEPE
ncbi:MAG: hypothetical protein HY077_11465 [Elusimicrobia bacterium]|nr:hypothetical protein [Elusimicrobiota bacterium]